MLSVEEGLLVCPACRGDLAASDGGRALGCGGCGARYDVPVEDGMPRLYRESEVRGPDRLQRAIYNRVGKIYDPTMRWVMPLLMGGSERALREAYIGRMELGAIRPRSDGKPVRILEVSIGTGANVELVRRALPAAVPVELWGLDLSLGLLAKCREKARDLKLVVGDAHALPFADGSFERVFHVGGITGFRDPGRALAELGRVAVPGSPIVVVDEQLDPAAARSPLQRALYRAYTFYAADPRAPTHLLPRAATDVLVEQLNRFYYGLRFRMTDQARP